MQTIFQTRFSFLGQSGWSGAASQSAKQLFDPDRLEGRFKLFEKITLASLLDQSDPDFRLMVLSSVRMPERFQTRLTELCLDTLGDRAEVIFRDKGRASRKFRAAMHERFADQPVTTQVVLDDDDALSRDFVAYCKAEAAHTAARPGFVPTTPHFLSFSKGFVMQVDANGNGEWLRPKRTPYINLGLAQVSSPMIDKTLFGAAHLMIGERHAATVIDDNRPFYLRTVHGLNDSRAQYSGNPLNAQEMQQAAAYFPVLAKLFPNLWSAGAD